jgi:hypothetical protein
MFITRNKSQQCDLICQIYLSAEDDFFSMKIRKFIMRHLHRRCLKRCRRQKRQSQLPTSSCMDAIRGYCYKTFYGRKL